MENVPDWDDLNLPKIEDDEDVARRLDRLYQMEDELKPVTEADGTTKYVNLGDGYVPSLAHGKIVMAFAALGIDPDNISDTLGIPVDVLRRYYGKELKTCSTVANAAVAQVALNAALSGRELDMTKFWLKTRAGWKEAAKQVEVSGPGGGPIVIDSARAKLAQLLDIEEAPREIERREEK
jgi:hypothetical protein